MSLPLAESHWRDALSLVGPNQVEVEPSVIFAKARSTNLSAYDAEYVALAESLGLWLVTSDKEILAACPQLASTPEDFVAA
ncbi:MAG: hypothetical protein ACR2OZ_12690 [Verrucomicrobiales bacterium]